MALSIRQNEIVELARAEGRVLVDDLAQRFEVTLQTIRRDLGDLAEAGLVDRVHGGAVLVAGVSNLGYDARRLLHQNAKEAIGRACADSESPRSWTDSIRARCVPSTSTFTVPSGSFSICRTVATLAIS